jgi:glycosyltransferase involved in cell wall biosynthesis
MAEPAFTVAIPAYNASRTVEAAIESVLAQTRGDFELFVADDGSIDDTAERVRPFEADPRVRLLRCEHSGIAGARNAAIAAGRAELVSMLDSDDLWMPDYLDVMGKTFERNPNAGVAYTDAWLLDDETRRIRRTTAMTYQNPPDSPPSDPREFLALLLRDNFVFYGATVCRSVLEAVGGYDETLVSGEDYELWLRIASRGYSFVRAPGLLAVYRKSPGTFSTNERMMLAGTREVYGLVAGEYGVPEEIRRLAHGRQRQVEEQLAAVDGAPGLRSALRRLRPRLIRVKLALTDPFMWHRNPPPEVAGAFPDLVSGPRAGR